MSNDQDNGEQNQKSSSQPEINFSFDGNAGDALAQGMDALRSVLGGIVGAVQDAIGPEGMRNLEASQWLTQAASSLESAAKGLREQGTVPAGKAGELTCFLERVDAEVRGSKFESQVPSLRQRLEDALQLIEGCSSSSTTAVSEQAINRLADSAGYFNAAAASVVLSNPTDDRDQQARG